MTVKLLFEHSESAGYITVAQSIGSVAQPTPKQANVCRQTQFTLWTNFLFRVCSK